jgi:methionyl-tRNA formyltransferase
MNKKRIVFMGTPPIAAHVLQALTDAGANVVLAVTQPDKKTGRKQIVMESPVKQLAKENNIPVFQPIKIRQDYQPILDAKPDLIVTCAYGQLVPNEVLDFPPAGCVNLHGSLLPKLRGGAPIQRAIMNGETVTGMTLMKMAEKMDAGDIAAQKPIFIEESDNTTTLFEKMGEAAAQLLMENLDKLMNGDIQFVPQDERLATFAPILSKAEEHLDLSKQDAQVLRQIRAFSGQPGAYVLAKGKKLKLLEGTYEHRENVSPSIYITEKHRFGLCLKEGIFWADKVQMEGKPVSSGKDFANGQGRSLNGLKAE